jgi:hypothetical protein
MNRHDQVLRKRLSGEGVGIVVKRYVEGLGFDPGQFAATACASASPLPPPANPNAPS